MGKIRYVIIIFATGFVLSCSSSKKFIDKDAFLDFILKPENGFVKVDYVCDVKAELIFLPTDYLVFQDFPSLVDSLRNKRDLKYYRTKYRNQLYFTLILSRNGKELLTTTNQLEYRKFAKSLIFNLGDFIVFKTASGNKLKLLDYKFLRTYGMSNANRILLVFSRPEDPKRIEDFEVKLKMKDLKLEDFSFKFLNNDFINKKYIEF